MHHFFLAKNPMRPACFFFPPAAPPALAFPILLLLLPTPLLEEALLFAVGAAFDAVLDGGSSSSASETSSHIVTVSVHMYPFLSTLVCSTSLFRRFLAPPLADDATSTAASFFLAKASMAPDFTTSFFFFFFDLEESTSITSSYSFSSSSLPFPFSFSACSSRLRLFSGSKLLRRPSNPALFRFLVASSVMRSRACLRAALATRALRAFSSSRKSSSSSTSPTKSSALPAFSSGVSSTSSFTFCFLEGLEEDLSEVSFLLALFSLSPGLATSSWEGGLVSVVFFDFFLEAAM
mmetsp:Transcript_29297/g.61772  ORF Transcript_29297/g.61772 Transcript_29297/m.61772 type:complete len:292 (+) Transcript_29297:179-1054(+)